MSTDTHVLLKLARRINVSDAELDQILRGYAKHVGNEVLERYDRQIGNFRATVVLKEQAVMFTWEIHNPTMIEEIGRYNKEVWEQLTGMLEDPGGAQKRKWWQFWK